MFLNWLADGLTVFFLSMLPVLELRAGIPYGIFKLQMNIWTALGWSIFGNIVAIVFVLKLLDPVAKWLFAHSAFLKHHGEKYFQKLHTKHSEKFNELGAVFLAIFVAVPIPGTGAWTGALIAYLLNIPFWLALGSISLGVVGAGIIVASFFGALDFFL